MKSKNNWVFIIVFGLIFLFFLWNGHTPPDLAGTFGGFIVRCGIAAVETGLVYIFLYGVFVGLAKLFG